MARKTKRTVSELSAEIAQARNEGDFDRLEALNEERHEAEVDADEAILDETDDGEAEASVSTPNSVVGATYKQRYIDRANSLAKKPKDVPMKALKRSNSDWLAIELAKRTLDPKAKLVIPQLEAILDANGVDYSKLNRTSRGWQGRFRMTTRLALQRVVAEAGELALPDGSAIAAPKVWVAKHAN